MGRQTGRIGKQLVGNKSVETLEHWRRARFAMGPTFNLVWCPNKNMVTASFLYMWLADTIANSLLPYCDCSNFLMISERTNKKESDLLQTLRKKILDLWASN